MKEKTKFKLGIYCISMMTMAVMIVSPTLEATAREFPDASSIAIQYITALPTLFAIPTALFTGALAKKIGGRSTGMLSMAIYCISAIGVILAKSVTAILVWRAVNGVAIGLTAVGLILQAQLFAPQERRAISGSTSFVSNALGLVFAVASGILVGAAGWRASYWIYVVLCFPAIFVMLKCLPSKAEIEQRMAAQMAQMPKDAQQGQKTKEPFNWGYYWVLFLLILCFICIGILSSNVALHIVGRGIGTSSTVGIAMMVNTLAAAIVGFFYDKISSKTKRWNFTIGPVIMGIGLIFAATATNAGILMLGQFISGIGWGYVLAESRLLIFGNTVPANRGTGLSLMSAIMNFGQFISPIVAVPIAGLIFGDQPADRFKLAAAIMILVGVLYAFIDPKKANKVAEI